ncbi:hypothetical protein QTP70_024703 [Hemibagrus guttatus]|uniref:Uncharacterized protein n=1 Tax=Hemibagrus guttatus TaxID=175788 RepID=A0AAE0RKP9_9TELE|nr:hypothetical protein QTP70_024703 [Hemibagrus guttatus]
MLFPSSGSNLGFTPGFTVVIALQLWSTLDAMTPLSCVEKINLAHCLPHDPTSALLWFSGGLQRIPLAMLPGPGDATTPVPYRVIQGGVYHNAAERQGTSLGRVPLNPESPSRSVLLRIHRTFQGGVRVTLLGLVDWTLAAKSGWNEQALLAAYRQGLDPQVRLHLAAYEDAIGLERLIQLSIRVATHMQSCVSKHQSQSSLNTTFDRPDPVSPPEPVPEPMHLGSSHLTPAE